MRPTRRLHYRRATAALKEHRLKARDLCDLRAPVARVAHDFKATTEAFQAWEVDDLIQEVLLRALTKLDQFQGRSSLKTWVVQVARNHLVSLARKAALRPRASGDMGEVHGRPQGEDEREGRRELRDSTRGLLDWLRESREVPWGFEVVKLMVKSHADWEYVALAMTLHTGRPWTVGKVRQVVRKVKDTERGRDLVASLAGTRR